MSDLLNKASLVVIPSGYKEDTVYSVVPTDGSGDLSFTRASNGTRINSAGLVEVCPWNLLQYSNTFSNSTWTKGSSITVTSGQTGYDGSSNAWLLSKGAIQYPAIGQSLVNSGYTTLSIYAKANTNTNICLFQSSSPSNFFQDFNLSNGTLGTNASGVVSASITSVGNGWYFCVVTFNGNTTTFDIFPDIIDGTNAGSVYIQNAQLNIGSTAKPYFPTTDRLNVPRLTYQNGGGGCPSLLLEKQSTNKCPDSNNFGTSAIQTTVTRNVVESPSGISDADRLLDNNANDEHLLGENFDSITNGQTYTLSVFFKADGTGGRGVIRYYGGEWVNAVYNLSNGTVSATDGNVVASIENYGNGWYRCILTHTAVMDYTPMVTQIGIANSSNQFSYQGATSLGVYFWGFQAEQSSYATSLINTNGASATRVADACFKTGISSLIGQTEGTLYYELQRNNTDNDSRLQISDGSTNNWFFVSIESGLVPRLYCVVGGTLQFSAYGSSVDNGFHKVAVAYKNNDFKVYIDGVSSITQTSGSVPTCSQLDIGNSSPSGSVVSPSQIKEVVVFKTRLTNAELASLTTI